MKRYIMTTIAALLCFVITFAQTDSRNRVASTIIADGLAQLPTNNPATFKQVMGEMAATGEQGIMQIAGNLKPVGNGVKNSVFEFALGGITDYVSSADGAKYKDGVRAGLAKAIEQCSDATNKSLLLTLLGKVATAEDFPVFAKYAGDERLGIPALAAIASMPGVDAQALNLVKTSTTVPRTALAKIAESRSLKGAEDVLLSWTSGADNTTLNAINSALVKVGGEKSLKYFASAAKKANFENDRVHAYDAYITMLNNIGGSTALKASKSLMKAKNPAVRCAGLRMMLSNDGSKTAKDALKALSDPDIQYRNTALEYSGKGFASTVAAKFDKLSVPAKIDVVRWAGTNHEKSLLPALAKSAESSDSTLATSAIKAAAKIGGDDAFNILAKQLTGKHSDVAEESLLAFNGDISNGINKSLDNTKDPATLVRLLKIAGTRHIHSAYSRVAALVSSSNAEVSNAAYDALSGVASESTYSNVASMLEKSSGAATSRLQEALCNSVAGLNASEQYAKASQSMSSSSHPEYYYPLLAQSASPEALVTLDKAADDPAKCKAAAQAMLAHGNEESVESLPILLKLAKNDSGDKNSILSRYRMLVNKNVSNKEEKYLYIYNALDLEPSENVANALVSDLGSTLTVQGLALAVAKINASQNVAGAASAIKKIIGSNASLNGGADVKKALADAKAYYKDKKAKGDADAGYAMDEITGIEAKTAENGYKLGNGVQSIEGKSTMPIAANGENIEFAFDWKADGDAVITLRSLPVITLSGTDGVVIPALKKTVAANKAGEWNTMKVRLVDDRIFITSNGTSVLSNAVYKEAAGVKNNIASGKCMFSVKSGKLTVRNLSINTLPATKTYTLSPEEKKAGFELLFDGHSLDKWQGNTVGYIPDNGTIFVTANYGGTGNLYTKKKYSDFIYRFEFCFETPGVNNGIGIRTEIGKDAAYYGMEIQVLDHDDPIYADLAPYQQHGSVYGIFVPKHVKFGKHGTWNTEEIRAIGDHITVTVNGEVITDCNIREACKGHNMAPEGMDRNPYTVDHNNHPGLFNKDGYISFCGHGPGVRFRNIRILDLSKKGGKTRK